LAQVFWFGWLATAGAAPLSGQSVPRIGVVSGPLGSFAATILKSHQQAFDPITNKTPGDSLGRFDLIVVDNLFKLQELNGAAFKGFVEKGGVLVIVNPKQDGFSRTWAPYDIYIGGFVREAKIVDKKHPLFKGFTSDKLEELADSNGPFVGNCHFAEPGKEWKVLAKPKKGDGAVIVEAGYGKGWIVAACVRFDNYNAKPSATRLGDNLVDYAISKAAAR
jgi:hypothetical protein